MASDVAMNYVQFQDKQKTPSKLVCIGRNYAAHAAELGNALPEQMVFFFKPNASISQRLKAFDGEPLHYEAEISFAVVGGTIRYVGFGLDLTKRKTQSSLKEKGLPWERSKAFRGAAVFSYFVPIDGDLGDLAVELLIDGVRTQFGSVAEMINKPAQILEEAASFIDLEDFDIVMTGTPSGVGELREGSLYEGVIWLGDKELVRASWRAEV